jgi:hypothetical protein
MTTACGQIVSRKVIVRNTALSGSVSALQADAVEWQACASLADRLTSADRFNDIRSSGQ